MFPSWCSILHRQKRSEHDCFLVSTNLSLSSQNSLLLPQYQNYYEKTGDWASLAWWIHRNVPSYCEMCFFKQQCALNIRWHEASEIGKTIKTFVINPETGNKKNLITNGIVADEYSEGKIRKCVNRAINLI